MRVLMVGPRRHDSMRRQVGWAVESGFEVLVASGGRPGDVWLPSSVRQVALFPATAEVSKQAALHKNSRRAAIIGALRLRALAEVFRPHIIHAYRLDFYTDICLRAGLKPLVVSVWGYMNRWLTNQVTRDDWWWLRRLRQGAHTLLVENSNMQEVLTERRLRNLRVAYLPIGVDGSLFRPGSADKAAAWRFALDIPSDAIVLLSPRGWSPTYGQQYIMQAFAALYQRLDRQLFLVLRSVGRMNRPDRLAQEVHDLGIALGVGHAIRWIPTIPFEDLPGVYALADIVVNYPLHDAFPSTLLEAAACARPVVTSDLPAYRNTFIERYCRLVEPESAPALADALTEMVIGGPAAWAVNVQQARQAVLTEFEESIQKQRLKTLYRQIAAEQVRVKPGI